MDTLDRHVDKLKNVCTTKSWLMHVMVMVSKMPIMHVMNQGKNLETIDALGLRE